DLSLRIRWGIDGIILIKRESGIIGGDPRHGLVVVTENQARAVKDATMAEAGFEIHGPHGGASGGRNVCHDECRMGQVKLEVEGVVLARSDHEWCGKGHLDR